MSIFLTDENSPRSWSWTSFTTRTFFFLGRRRKTTVQMRTKNRSTIWELPESCHISMLRDRWSAATGSCCRSSRLSENSRSSGDN